MRKLIKKNKIIILAYILMSSILLTSCIGSRELQTLAIVTAIGLDREGEEVLITCEIINPTTASSLMSSSPTSSTNNIVFAQGKGRTVFEAIRDIPLHFDRKLFFSHSNVLILGEEFAKRGITEFMDIFLRDNEPRENLYMVVAKGVMAYEIMGVRGELSQSAGNYIYDIIENFKYNGKCVEMTMSEYYRYYYDVSNEPVIGVVEKIEKKVIDEERKKDTPTKYILDISGGAALKRDYLLGYFSEDEIFGYNFITNGIKGGLITFKTPKGLTKGAAIIGKEGEFTSVEIFYAKTKRNIEITEGKILLNIDVKLRAGLGEESKAVDVGNLEVIHILEEASSKEVKRLISATMDKGQKQFKQDNFSIGEIVHQQHPEVWKEISKDWNSIFPEISYKVNVEIDIVKTGIINVPSNLRKRR